MNSETVTYNKERIIQVLKDLEVLVVSIDRIGSAFHDCESDEQYNAMFIRFFDDFAFFKKLAAARSILSEPFSEKVGPDEMDELERLMQDLKFWTAPQD